MEMNQLYPENEETNFFSVTKMIIQQKNILLYLYFFTTANDYGSNKTF